MERENCELCYGDFDQAYSFIRNGSKVYNCLKCQKIVCRDCVGLTSHGGIEEGICKCKECFDYLCRTCRKFYLPRAPGFCFIEDGTPSNECSGCRLEKMKKLPL